MFIPRFGRLSERVRLNVTCSLSSGIRFRERWQAIAGSRGLQYDYVLFYGKHMKKERQRERDDLTSRRIFHDSIHLSRSLWDIYLHDGQANGEVHNSRDAFAIAIHERAPFSRLLPEHKEHCIREMHVSLMQHALIVAALCAFATQTKTKNTNRASTPRHGGTSHRVSRYLRRF